MNGYLEMEAQRGLKKEGFKSRFLSCSILILLNSWRIERVSLKFLSKF